MLLERCSSNAAFKPRPGSPFAFQNDTGVPSRATCAFDGSPHHRESLTLQVLGNKAYAPVANHVHASLN